MERKTLAMVGRLDTVVGKRKRRMEYTTISTTNWIFYTGIVFLVFCVSFVVSSGDDAVSDSSIGIAHHEQVLSKDEEAAKRLLDKIEQEVHAECHNHIMKSWIYATNITRENANASAEASISYSRFMRRTWAAVQKFDWRSFKDPVVKRKFKLMSVLGLSILPEEKLRQYNEAKQGMERTYSTAKICSYHDSKMCNLTLEPELTDIFKESRDPEELKYYWKQWRDLSGKQMRKDFVNMIGIMDLTAKLNNFSDAADYEVRAYDSKTFRDDIEEIWQRMKPFYEELHAYVRFKLREFYGEEIVPKKWPMPAHLLGNMWAHTWENVYDIVIPYPNKSAIDVTPKMREKGLTPYDMAKMAEKFFVSLNLSAMPDEFWKGSILEKPKDREIMCHASAWDMCNRKDFWIKQCTHVNEEDLITLHHEMGHIQYQIQYKDLPKVFRDGANPGFHEAIGDLISISVQTPDHLHAIGLLDNVENDFEADINYLLKTALVKIAFLPFGYLMDLWRWDVYTRKTSAEDLNCHWWKLREKYQGVYPPMQRTEQDFDPGSKYHVASNYAYIRYFVSMILQFQFHEALCVTAKQMIPVYGRGKPLYKCDIYQSKEAGEKLGAMLRMGASKPWEDAMEAITGGRSMSAGPMLDYFDPLMKWLKNENKKNGEFVGWISPDTETCGKTAPTTTSTSTFSPDSEIHSQEAIITDTHNHHNDSSTDNGSKRNSTTGDSSSKNTISPDPDAISKSHAFNGNISALVLIIVAMNSMLYLSSSLHPALYI